MLDIAKLIQDQRKEMEEKVKDKKCYECREFVYFGNDVGVCCLEQVPKVCQNKACQWFIKKGR